MDDQGPGPGGWFWVKVVGAVVGLAAAFALFVPFSSFDAETAPGTEGCASGWTNVVGIEFCGDFPVWVPVVAGLLGIVVGWGTVALVRRLVRQRL